jgi:hypothetical protein
VSPLAVVAPGPRVSPYPPFSPEFDSLESASFTPVLVVFLLRHVLIILVILARVGRHGLQGNFRHKTSLQVLFVAL